MSNYTALLDANVLYPAPLRDLLLQLAVTDLFKARWSDDIHREWIEALLRNEPHRSRTAIERTRDLMNSATRDCLIREYEYLIPSLELPDANARLQNPPYSTQQYLDILTRNGLVVTAAELRQFSSLL